MNQRVWLGAAMHLGFFLLLTASATRLLVRHDLDRATVAALVLCGVLALLYGAGVSSLSRLGRALPVWLGAVIAVWLVLVLLAPSFGWCAVPLFFLCLRYLSPPTVVAAAVVLTGAVILGQIRITEVFDPSLILAPVGIAVMITVVFWALDRDITTRQSLIDDLLATRGVLADSQRRTGVLAERERLAREIHDTLAQGLSSIGMLLQAADRAWDATPEKARDHVRRASVAAAQNLSEARRFVADLQPAVLEDRSLPQALALLCVDRARDSGLSVEFRSDGDEYPVGREISSVLLRIAQGALANVVEHAEADTAVVTLSYLQEQISLDVYDDGRGFDSPASAPGRGYGLRTMRDRLAELGGHLTVESTPGAGTAIAATIPVSREDRP